MFVFTFPKPAAAEAAGKPEEKTEGGAKKEGESADRPRGVRRQARKSKERHLRRNSEYVFVLSHDKAIGNSSFASP